MSTLGQKLSPVLEEISDTLWESEANNPRPHEYTDKGFHAATKIFMSAMMDKMWILQEEEDMPLNERIKMVEFCGKRIRKLILEMTGKDSHKFYEM